MPEVNPPVVKVPPTNVVVPLMEPFLIRRFLRTPLILMPLPMAGLAVELMAKPFRSRVTLSALMVMAVPVATVRLAVR